MTASVQISTPVRMRAPVVTQQAVLLNVNVERTSLANTARMLENHAHRDGGVTRSVGPVQAIVQ